MFCLFVGIGGGEGGEKWGLVWLSGVLTERGLAPPHPLLRHYKSDLAHLSDFDSLVIGLSKS